MSILQSIQEHITAGKFETALDELSSLQADEPDNTEALYMTAVCQRYLQRWQTAAANLERLKNLAPDLGRAHQEEGHLRRAMGQDQEALRAYAQALQINPALEASLRNQLEILVAQGSRDRALQIKNRLDQLQALPKPLLAVTDLISQGKLLRAEDICRQFLQKVPHHVEGMRLLADIGLKLGALDEAEFLLESAAQFEPGNTQVRIDYILALRKRQKFVRALEEAEKLLGTAPDNPQYQSLVAIESMQTGDYNAALAHFDRVLERMPGDPITLTSRGHALKTCGRGDDAIADYRAALTNHPQHGEAYYALANLKTYKFSDHELTGMVEQAGNTSLGLMERVYLFFAIAKASEDRADYERAFHYYQHGNDLMRAQSRYQASRMSEEIRSQAEACTASLFEAKRGNGCESPDPIFIIGLPRAGSTLLEQILSSHSQVDGTLELPNILSLTQRLRRRRNENGATPGYPDVLEQLSPDKLAEFGQQYIDETRVHRQGAPFFIDKMPNNFRHIGLIRMILPNARIIDARRHPMACCFSGYKQLFAEGQEFSYSLSDLGVYYRDYVGLMQHWDAVIPGFVLRVQHEDVIDDLEGQVRRILDFCDLPFEEQCLSYWETERAVRTPSSEQVRQPIFKSSQQQWQHFSNWLDPLRDALGNTLTDYRGLPSEIEYSTYR